MTADVPNAYIEAPMPEVKPVLVDMLVELSPDVYGPYVVFQNGPRVLYVQVWRAIYGVLQAVLLWCSLWSIIIVTLYSTQKIFHGEFQK